MREVVTVTTTNIRFLITSFIYTHKRRPSRLSNVWNVNNGVLVICGVLIKFVYADLHKNVSI